MLVKVERNKDNSLVFIVPKISISPLSGLEIIYLHEMLNAATPALIDSNTLSLSHKDFSLTVKVNEKTRILEN
jgi:hypothetical protein